MGVLLSILLAASAADLPSFPCNSMNSIVEAAICADPELAAYDRAMALAYPRMTLEARKTQKAWLAERNRCGDSRKVRVCLRRAYVDRLLSRGGVFGSIEKPENATVLVFRRSEDGGPGGIAILDVGGGKLVYHLWSTFFSYAYNSDHPREISGDTYGVIAMDKGTGHEIATKECDFTISRHGNGWTITDSGPCLGVNNNPDGTYLPRRR